MRLLITNIGILAGIDNHRKLRLSGKEMSRFETLADAWLLVEDGRFSKWGCMAAMPAEGINADQTVDAQGGCVMPSWCDPHTHIVYAGSREGEFVDKIRGLSYAEIAKRGGGILNCSIPSAKTSSTARPCTAPRRLCARERDAWR